MVRKTPYIRVPITIETKTNKLTAYVYKSDDPGLNQPTNEYLDTILTGMEKNGFSKYYIQHVQKMKI